MRVEGISVDKLGSLPCWLSHAHFFFKSSLFLEEKKLKKHKTGVGVERKEWEGEGRGLEHLCTLRHTTRKEKCCEWVQVWNKKAAPSRHRAPVFLYLLAPVNHLLGVNQMLRDRAE